MALKPLNPDAYETFRTPRRVNPFKPLKKPPINLGRQRAKTALLAQIVPDLVTSMRTFHMQTAVAGVTTYQQKGEFFQDGDKVATIVDGSTRRKVTNVKLGGNITFAQGSGTAQVIEAAQVAYLTLVEESRRFYRSGGYMAGITMAVDGTDVPQPSTLTGRNEPFQQIELFNTTIYSGRIERHYQPFLTTWQVLRASGWMERVAIRLVIGGNPLHRPVGDSDGKKHTSIAMPLMVFGLLGSFESRPPNRGDFYS